MSSVCPPDRGAGPDAAGVPDREYKYNMNKVGLEGVNTMERMAKSKLEQKSLQSGLANMRRAFEPYDHDHTGECTPEVLRKALEVELSGEDREPLREVCRCLDCSLPRSRLWRFAGVTTRVVPV